MTTGAGGSGRKRAADSEAPGETLNDYGGMRLPGGPLDGAERRRFSTVRRRCIATGPSRSSFLSGRLPLHVNQFNGEIATQGGGVPKQMETIADKLRGRGCVAAKREDMPNRTERRSKSLRFAPNGGHRGWLPFRTKRQSSSRRIRPLPWCTALGVVRWRGGAVARWGGGVQVQGLPLIRLAAALLLFRYATWQIGKWHGGMSRPELLPINRGFDHSFGFLGGACGLSWLSYTIVLYSTIDTHVHIPPPRIFGACPPFRSSGSCRCVTRFDTMLGWCLWLIMWPLGSATPRPLMYVFSVSAPKRVCVWCIVNPRYPFGRALRLRAEV